MITLDDTDQEYIKDVLIKARVVFALRMTDEAVCEANRKKARECSKMTTEALNILNGLKAD